MITRRKLLSSALLTPIALVCSSDKPRTLGLKGAIAKIGIWDGSGVNHISCTDDSYIGVVREAANLTSNYGGAPFVQCPAQYGFIPAPPYNPPNGIVYLTRYGHASRRPIRRWAYNMRTGTLKRLV